MKIVFTITLLISFCFSFAAEESSGNKHKPHHKKEYKISKKDFLDKYGCDDSSKALINYFFYLRTGQGNPDSVRDSSGSSIDASGLSPKAAMWFFIIVFGLAIIVCTIPLIAYPRKKLLVRLKKYYNGEPIPVKISQNKTFRKIILPNYKPDKKLPPKQKSQTIKGKPQKYIFS